MHWCPGIGPRARSFLRDYDALQSLALALIYLQIGCALIGSLGALFNGVLVINLVIGLFAVVAIESSSQRLGRTYAVLLFFAIVLDVAWFILFSHAIWNSTPDEKYGQLFVFSLRLALWMQTIGFSVRFLSSFIWIQMYRLGVSSSTPTYYEANDARNSFLSPRSNSVRRGSMADDILGGSIYDPSYYSSLFEDVRNNACNHQKTRSAMQSGTSSCTSGFCYGVCMSMSRQWKHYVGATPPCELAHTPLKLAVVAQGVEHDKPAHELLVKEDLGHVGGVADLRRETGIALREHAEAMLGTKIRRGQPAICMNRQARKSLHGGVLLPISELLSCTSGDI
ncbi:hypothetical protein CFC21_016792 [Triticum aestivum]|uniref:Uncharacterized protein n=3 Tax=Triticum TaxID=4564 RepID=A0A9R1NSG9_TRITD|nr:uncharacterized protein LOC119354582 isoform X3 [Triticum dicoccoides]XP_044456801.1 uncharacterized protein LOC123188653 isoform X1 [Triticum aestivum]KAF7001041.1 hypothetical protein CFC21_016792 [Triticum aestivum]VAH30331.1 unnamed protein product [Triticum turgidum subsp. durum]